MKNVLLLLAVVIGYFFGVYFYCRGFLLTRNALLMNSTCVEVQAEKTEACWMEPMFKKAVLIVIDALRYDFIAPQPVASVFPYHNKFTSVRDVLKNSPKNGILFKFVADPPTTTLQRLKALTTGSLPTFVDAGSNFDGSKIEEDNLIDQITRRNGRKVVFTGDDTWVSLFPTQFSRRFAFPSFDVKDLHTVDDGVTRHLLPELSGAQDDWTLLIGHFLGVDHCGHKFGPNHPEMAAKLTQLDDILRMVMGNMSEDTVLFVLGDHGMTQTGDHGGDSADETNAALFVYSPRMLHDEQNNIRDAVSQVDLVPTISMLLDSPIPYSNLGAFIQDLFPDDAARLRAARANVNQVVRYTESYLTNFPDAVLSERFQPILKVFYSLEVEELTVDKCLSIVREIGRIFVECWAKFHLGWMTLGILTLCETFLWSISILSDRRNSLSGRKVLLKIFVFALCSLVVSARNETIPPVVGVILTGQVVLHIHTVVYRSISNAVVDSIDFPSILSIFVVIFHALSQFSNSFVVYDDLASQFSVKTLLILIFWTNFCRKKAKSANSATSSASIFLVKGRKKLILNRSANADGRRIDFKATMYLLIAILLIRSASWCNRCREEQANCSASPFTLPFGGLFADETKLTRIALAIFSLFFISGALTGFLRRNGHFNFPAETSSCFSWTIRYGTGLVCLAVLFHWFLQWIPEKYAGQIAIPVVSNPAVFVYLYVAVSLGAYCKNPTLTFYRRLVVSERKFADTVDAFRHMKSNWRQFFGSETERDEENKVVVCGAQSSCSASFASLLWIWIWLSILLLGDGITPQICCFLLVSLVALEFRAESSPTFMIVLLFVELASHFFYAFGHHATFSSIPWEAAFIGVPGNFGFQWIQGTLVVLHLAASYLAASFALPLIVVWSAYAEKSGPFRLRSTTAEDEDENEFKFAANQRSLLDAVTFCDLTFLTALAGKLIAVVVASTVHRRHLMVWKIFAPKFIFDAILFIVACFSVLTQYLFVVRFSVSLTKIFTTISTFT